MEIQLLEEKLLVKSVGRETPGPFSSKLVASPSLKSTHCSSRNISFLPSCLCSKGIRCHQGPEEDQPLQPPFSACAGHKQPSQLQLPPLLRTELAVCGFARVVLNAPLIFLPPHLSFCHSSTLQLYFLPVPTAWRIGGIALQ